MSNIQQLVVVQPMWQRVLFTTVSATFAVGGYFILTNGKDTEQIVGGMAVLFFSTLCFFAFLLKSRIVFMADVAGIIPSHVLPRGSSKRIPWEMISKISKVNQKVDGNRFSYLAIYLHDPHFLDSEQSSVLRIFDFITKLLRSLGFYLGMSDKSTARVYIPAVALPGFSVERALDQLDSIKPGIVVRQEKTLQSTSLFTRKIFTIIALLIIIACIILFMPSYI